MAIWLRAREEFADNRFQLLFIYIDEQRQPAFGELPLLWRLLDRPLATIVHVKCYIIILLPCKCIHNVLFLLMCIVYIYCCSLCVSLTAMAPRKKSEIRTMAFL